MLHRLKLLEKNITSRHLIPQIQYVLNRQEWIFGSRESLHLKPPDLYRPYYSTGAVWLGWTPRQFNKYVISFMHLWGRACTAFLDHVLTHRAIFVKCLETVWTLLKQLRTKN